MNNKFYLDTNILLDFTNKERENYKTAQRMINLLVSKKATFIFAEDIISTIFYLNRKNNTTLNVIVSDLKSFEISPYFEIVNFGMECRINAYNHFLEYSGDLEDLLQYFCAKKENCAAIITQDGGFPKLDIPVLNYDNLKEIL